MIKYKLLGISLVFLLCSFKQLAGIPVGWNKLQEVEFQTKYVAEIKMDMLFPKFTPELKSLNGQLVEISGFVVPFDKVGAKIALSANSYAACYFCGKAGPASIMSIILRTPNPKYKTDQYKKFVGKLRLNDSNIREFYYILEAAEEVK